MNAYELFISPEDAVAAAQLGMVASNQHTGATGWYPAFNPYAGAQEMSGSATTGDIASQLAEVAGLMDAADVAIRSCPSLAQSDIDAWTGTYRAWATMRGSLAECTSGMPPGDSHPPSFGCTNSFGFNWEKATEALSNYRQLANGYMARVQNAGCHFTPPPQPSPSGGGGGQPCGWFDALVGRCSQPSSDTSWAPAAKWIAIAGIVAIAAWAVGPLVAALASAGASRIAAGKPRGELEA